MPFRIKEMIVYAKHEAIILCKANDLYSYNKIPSVLYMLWFKTNHWITLEKTYLCQILLYLPLSFDLDP